MKSDVDMEYGFSNEYNRTHPPGKLPSSMFFVSPPSTYLLPSSDSDSGGTGV